MKPTRPAAALACAAAIVVLSAPRPARAEAAAQPTATPAAPAPPASGPAPTGDAPEKTRTITLHVPVEVEVHGRLYVGVAADARDDWERQLGMRSARIGFEARVPGVVTVVEADVVSKSPIEDAYVRLDGPLATRLQAGRFKAPFSARRLESSWRLPLVDRGLVDDYVVARNDLGGRRLGAMAGVRPWDGRVQLLAGAFVADKKALDGARAQDYAALASVRPWKGVEVGVTGYRAGAEGGPRRQAASSYLAVNVGPIDATVEGLAGRLVQGPFAAATAIAGWTFKVGAQRRLRVTPIAGGEAMELRGDIPGQGHAVIAGAVLSWAEGLKVKVQGERALRPGDDTAQNAVAVELATRF